MQNQSVTTRYRVHTPLVAMTVQNDGRSYLIAVPRGSVMETVANQGSAGFVDVMLNGLRLAVFSRDIDERTERTD